jgi:polyhydroxyalkanoate synthesis regulator phasin
MLEIYPFIIKYLCFHVTYETNTIINNIYTAKSPVVSDYLKTEIEKHQQVSQAANVASKADVTELQSRVNHLENVSISSSSNLTYQENPALESLVDRQAAKTNRSIEELNQRVARLEEAVSNPIMVCVCVYKKKKKTRDVNCMYIYCFFLTPRSLHL